MTLFWILSKNRSKIGSRVDPTLEMDRLDVLGQVFFNIDMPILRSSKSMIFADSVAFYAIFGFKLLYFDEYDFQKSIFSPCGMNDYGHDLGLSKTNLDVFYPILNLFFALNDQNHPNPKCDVAYRFRYTRILRALNERPKNPCIPKPVCDVGFRVWVVLVVR